MTGIQKAYIEVYPNGVGGMQNMPPGIAVAITALRVTIPITLEMSEQDFLHCARSIFIHTNHVHSAVQIMNPVIMVIIIAVFLGSTQYNA